MHCLFKDVLLKSILQIFWLFLLSVNVIVITFDPAQSDNIKWLLLYKQSYLIYNAHRLK